MVVLTVDFKGEPTTANGMSRRLRERSGSRTNGVGDPVATQTNIQKATPAQIVIKHEAGRRDVKNLCPPRVKLSNRISYTTLRLPIFVLQKPLSSEYALRLYQYRRIGRQGDV